METSTVRQRRGRLRLTLALAAAAVVGLYAATLVHFAHLS